MKKYQPKDFEQKWQQKWRDTKIFSPDIRNATKPFYALMMFPYPSAEGLHVGNMYPFTAVDIIARYKRMNGFDVFVPIGLDAFGIHSENYALKVNKNPMELTDITGKHYYDQLTMIGNSFDWTKTLETHKSEYYKWTQWIFIQMYKAGLAVQKEATVNWCPSCLTVLADEQVISGKCERCSTEVVQKELKQWFFRITEFADQLLTNLESEAWSDRIRLIQKNWIGKKSGINITYQIEGSLDEVVCFTTRPDTNFGATFIVLGPEHPLIQKITQKEQFEQVEKYIKDSLKKTEQERIESGRIKTGAFTGSYAINNLNGDKLPIWVSDFVLGNFGTGAVVGVPGHDIRDFEFAKQFGLSIKRVVVGKDGDKSDITQVEQVQEEEGVMINSRFLDGLDIHQATEKIMDYLEEKGWGKRITTYHLRDWLISRQRYWGPPIPMIYCDKCGVVPVPEADLPVILPETNNFRPTGTGKSPLASIESFVNVKCPNCGVDAKRETDVSDNFLDSAWYFFRYPSVGSKDAVFDPEITKKWLPVDLYMGGFEHALLHLMYTRFITMVFKKLGLIDFEEPFKRFIDNGHILSEGMKMSKSKGNVVNPDDYIKEYGADTLRMYLMFLAPITDGGDFRKEAVTGIYKFLQRVWKMIVELPEEAETTTVEKQAISKATKAINEDLESAKRFNTAISELMQLLNAITKQGSASKETKKTFLTLLAPFAPHITEELWEMMGEEYSIHTQKWPTVDEQYLTDAQFNLVIQINGKVRENILIDQALLNDQVEVEKIVLASAKLKKYLENAPKKTIYVPGKVLSILT